MDAFKRTKTPQADCSESLASMRGLTRPCTIEKKPEGCSLFAVRAADEQKTVFADAGSMCARGSQTSIWIGACVGQLRLRRQGVPQLHGKTF